MAKKNKLSKAGQRALQRVIDDDQAGLPPSDLAGEFVAEEMAEELRKPKSRKPLKDLVEAGLKKAKKIGLSIHSWKSEIGSHKPEK